MLTYSGHTAVLTVYRVTHHITKARSLRRDSFVREAACINGSIWPSDSHRIRDSPDNRCGSHALHFEHQVSSDKTIDAWV